MPEYLVSHFVYRWHNELVPSPGRVELAHRATGGRRSLAVPLWQAVTRALRRPRDEAGCVRELAAAGFATDEAAREVRALIDERFLVEPGRDFWSDFVPDAAAEATPADLARDRLRWARDVIDPHGLWMYPRWLGFPVLQWPPDMVWMQALLVELRPAFVVETGLFRGGSAMFYASILELLGAGRVITVERWVDPRVRDAIAAHPLGRRISIVEGSSADPQVAALVGAMVGGPGPHLVALDSDHAAEHVRAELETYGPLVRGAGKLVVFDTTMSLCPRFAASNPHQAVRAFLAAHPEWRISPWAGASFVSACEDGVLERLPEA